MEVSAAFPFESKYVDVHGSKMHYVEEGSGDPILFIHGNPTSSYLWRNIIPHAAAKGRAIAFDLIGMGKSDKPDIEYRFFDHVKYVEGFIEALDLRNITLMIHDWGTAYGFHYAMRHEDNIKGIAFAEAFIAPIASWEEFPAEMRETFQAIRTTDMGHELIIDKNFFVEQALPGDIVRTLTDAEMEHYRTPFRESASRKPLLQFPREIPIAGEPSDVSQAMMDYNRRLQQSGLPKLFFISKPGAMPVPMVNWCKQNLKNLTVIDLGEGLHFIQEDKPHLIGTELVKWYEGLA